MGNGKRLDGLPIAVDYWAPPKLKEKFKTYLYFLTHMHTDHTVGLTSTWTETVYTSQINKDLMITMLNVKPEIIKVLEIGTTYSLELPAEHGSTQNKNKVSVTPIDANHIKGSVMYLFEGNFGKILFTGDFRWCNAMKEDPFLKTLSESKSLDLLYADNTFEEVGMEFPSREECLKKVIDIVDKHKYHRIIFGAQKIGKENVLYQAALHLQQQLYVPENIRQVYGILGIPEHVLTTNQTESLLWYAPLRTVNGFDLKNKNLEMPTIAIVLTASEMLFKSTRSFPNDLVFSVPYSNHCSASELTTFLEFVQPARIEKIVAPSSKKPVLESVISYYLSSRAVDVPAEITDDMEATENGDFQELYIKEREEDESVDEHKGETQDPLGTSVPCQSTSNEEEEVISRAQEVITSIHLELDQNDPKHIYSSVIIEKLRSLTEIYAPLTGISFDD